MIKLWKFIRRITDTRWNRLFAALLALNAVWGVMAIMEPDILRRGIAIIQANDIDALMLLGIITVVVTAGMISSKYLIGRFRVRLENGIQKSLTQNLMQKMVDTSHLAMGKRQFGEVSVVVINNAVAFAEAFINATQSGAQGLAAMLISIIYMAVVDWRLMLCIVGFHVLFRLFTIGVIQKNKKNEAEAIAAKKEGNNFLTSLLTNMLAVRLATNKEFFQLLVKNREKNVLRKGFKTFAWSNGYAESIWGSSKCVGIVLVYGVGTLLLYRDQVPLGVLLAFVFIEDFFNNGTFWFSNALNDWAKAVAQYNSFMPFYAEADVEAGDVEAGKPDALADALTDAAALIRVDDVSFGYTKDNPVVRHASFEIRSGEKVLIRGGNGEGKSTLLKLLCGLYRPDEGAIYYGHQDISVIHLDSILKEYAYISQQSYILDGDVRSNVAFSNEFDERKVDGVLAKLKIGHTVDTPPQSLSMGERQRMNIGRAMYKDSVPIIIGDEIFANVDIDSRSSILELLKTQFAGKTVILISHDSIDGYFDRVFNVEIGIVREVPAV